MTRIKLTSDILIMDMLIAILLITLTAPMKVKMMKSTLEAPLTTQMLISSGIYNVDNDVTDLHSEAEDKND